MKEVIKNLLRHMHIYGAGISLLTIWMQCQTCTDLHMPPPYSVCPNQMATELNNTPVLICPLAQALCSFGFVPPKIIFACVCNSSRNNHIT